MREVWAKVYEKQDYEEAKNMGLDEVVDILDWIDDGWIGRSSYYDQEDYEGDQGDYNRYRLHIALKKAMYFIRNRSKE